MTPEQLYQVILDRKRAPRRDSYVSALLSAGKDAVLKKIGEEAAETIIAAKGGKRDEIVHELADLWFHCLVLMAEEGITPADISGELEERHKAKSG